MRPSHFGKYSLIDKLGRGRVTDVFLAVPDPHSGVPAELVVLKRLRSSRTHADELRGQDVAVPADARLACQLSHPNIAVTYEVSEADEMPYWAIEHLHGKPLDALLAAAPRRGGLPAELGLWIVACVLRALDYAHTLRDPAGEGLAVAHGDVRPHNVFITYSGEVKLLDFCVARRARKRDAEGTQEDAFVAPELASGAFDGRADIYAAGRLLEAVWAVRGAGPSLMSAPSPDATAAAGFPFDGPVRAVCWRATQDDADARHPSASAMGAEVEALLLNSLAPERNLADAMPATLAGYMHDAFDSDREDAEARLALLQVAPNTGPSSFAQDEMDLVDSVAMVVDDASESISVDHEHDHEPDESEARAHGAPLASEPRPRASILPPAPPDTSVAIEPSAMNRGLVLLFTVLATIAFVGIRQRTASAPNVSAAAAGTNELAPKTDPHLRLCGSNTIGAELAPALVQGLFEHEDHADRVAIHRDVDSELVQLTTVGGDAAWRATISALGSSTAFQELAQGRCDVGMASRSITGAELEALRNAGHGDLSSEANEHVIALDGVAVVVHPNNPVNALDLEALRSVFTGQVKDWSELGGSAGAIRLHAHDDNSGTFDLFKELVLGGATLSASAKRYAVSEALSDTVASDPGAIGFTGLAYVRTAKALAVSEPGAAPRLPSQLTIATESYPLSRRLYLYTSERARTPWATQLINFALSPRGQKIVTEAQFVNLDLVSEVAACSDQPCPARYGELVAAARRISVDLHFKAGDNQPDTRARRDLDRVSSFLRDFREPRLLLLGFSDDLAEPAVSLRLSQERAQAIAHAMKMRGVQLAAVTGFGAELPVASNDSERGRARNRRVEVWFEHD